MLTKFRDKYRIESPRLPGFDYSSEGAYFITICTKNKEKVFGNIIDGKLLNNKPSEICRAVWLDLPNYYPGCILDAFVIMPNHVHGIIIVDMTSSDDRPLVDHQVETIHELSLRAGRPSGRRERRQMLIPKMIGRFKMQTAKQINLLQNTSGKPVWQKNYYDRIIRDENELNRIRQYILDNPANWKEDNGNEDDW